MFNYKYEQINKTIRNVFEKYSQLLDTARVRRTPPPLLRTTGAVKPP